MISRVIWLNPALPIPSATSDERASGAEGQEPLDNNDGWENIAKSRLIRSVSEPEKLKKSTPTTIEEFLASRKLAISRLVKKSYNSKQSDFNTFAKFWKTRVGKRSNFESFAQMWKTRVGKRSFEMSDFVKSWKTRVGKRSVVSFHNFDYLQF